MAALESIIQNTTQGEKRLRCILRYHSQMHQVLQGIRLYIGEEELCGGTIGEAGIIPGTVVQAVTCESLPKALDFRK